MSHDNLLFITFTGNTVTAHGCRLVSERKSYGGNYLFLDRADGAGEYELFMEGGKCGSSSPPSKYLENLHKAILEKVKAAWKGDGIVDLQGLTVEGRRGYKSDEDYYG